MASKQTGGGSGTDDMRKTSRQTKSSDGQPSPAIMPTDPSTSERHDHSISQSTKSPRTGADATLRKPVVKQGPDQPAKAFTETSRSGGTPGQRNSSSTGSNLGYKDGKGTTVHEESKTTKNTQSVLKYTEGQAVPEKPTAFTTAASHSTDTPGNTNPSRTDSIHKLEDANGRSAGKHPKESATLSSQSVPARQRDGKPARESHDNAREQSKEATISSSQLIPSRQDNKKPPTETHDEAFQDFGAAVMNAPRTNYPPINPTPSNIADATLSQLIPSRGDKTSVSDPDADTKVSDPGSAVGSPPPELPPRSNRARSTSTEPVTMVTTSVPAELPPRSNRARSTSTETVTTMTTITTPAPATASAIVPIHTGWENLTFQIKWNYGNATFPFDASADICPIKLQYALTGRMEGMSVEALENKNIKISREKTAIIFMLDGTEFRNCDEVTEFIIKTINEHVISEIGLVGLMKNGQKCLAVLKALKHAPPEKILKNYVNVFETQASICLVGKKESLDKVVEELYIEVKPTARSVSIVVHHKLELMPDERSCLKALELNKYLQEMDQNVEIDFTTDELIGYQHDIDKALVTLQQFKKRLAHRKVTFNHKDCAKIFLEENGEKNDNVYAYIKRKLVQSNLIKASYLTVNEGGNVPEVAIVCRDASSAQKACTIVSDCVHIHKFKLTEFDSDEAKQFLNEWNQKHKVRCLDGDQEYFHLICTSDLSKTIQDIHDRIVSANKVDSFQCPPMIFKFLSTFGADIIGDIEERFNVKIDLQGNDNKLSMKGSIENIIQAKTFYKQELPKRMTSVTLQIPDAIFSQCLIQLDEVISNNQCYQTTKYDSETEEQLVKNGSYIATWYDPGNKGKVTLIEGHPAELDVDLLVLLVSDNLFPLHPDFMSDKKASEAYLTETKNRVENASYSIGEAVLVHYPKSELRIHSKETICLVVYKTQKTQWAKELNLTEYIGNIMNHAYKNKCRTVGFSLSWQQEIHLKLDIIREIPAAAATFLEQHEDANMEMVLCCNKHTRPVEAIVESLDNIYSKMPGFARKLHKDGSMLSGSLSPRKLNTKIKVKDGSLHECKRDVIVNTTSKDLKLSQGFVSNMILQVAGNCIQGECDRYYPKGLKPGEIAVTGAGQLQKKGVKAIFHGALPNLNIGEHMNKVKQFVKTCLFKAEKVGTKSIAFPALGVGNRGYPRRNVAHAMFEAVDEYLAEAVNPRLQKVTFVVYSGDEGTCRAFVDEEWRRSKAGHSDLGLVPEHFQDSHVEPPTPSLRKLVSSVAVTVTSKDNISRMPSYCVLVFLRNMKLEYTQMGGVTHYLKTASADVKKTWNDHLEIRVDNPDLPAAVLACMNFCESYRVTDIVIHTSTALSIPVGEQAKMMVDTMANYKAFTYLRNVTIAVYNDAAFYNAEMSLLSKKTKSFLSIFSSDGDDWQKVEETKTASTEVTIKLLAKTPESLEKVRGEIQKVIAKADRSQTITNQSQGVGVAPAHSNDDGKRLQTTTKLLKDGDVSPTNSNASLFIDSKRQTTTKASQGNVSPVYSQAPVNADKDEKSFNEMGARPKTQPTKSPLGDTRMTVDTVPKATPETDEGFEENLMFGDITAEVDSLVLKYSYGNPAWLQKIAADCHVTVVSSNGKVPVLLKGHLQNIINIEERLHVIVQRNTLPADGNTENRNTYDNKIDSESESDSESEQSKKVVSESNSTSTESSLLADEKYEHYKSKETIRKAISIATYQAMNFLLKKEMEGITTHASGMSYSDGEICIQCKPGQEELVGGVLENVLYKMHQVQQSEMSLDANEMMMADGVVAQVFNETYDVYCFFVPNEGTIVTMAFDYQRMKEAENKIKKKLGRHQQSSTRNQRQFDTTQSLQIGYTETEGASNKVQRSLSRSSSHDGYNRDVNGVTVRVYEGDITKLQVDCIVNAANETLNSSMGVARAISRAAGNAYEDECRSLAQTYGKLQIGEICETTAGKLPCKSVIQAVGSAFDHTIGKERRLAIVKETIVKCLDHADGRGFSSIALPSIAAGATGLSIDDCALQYCSAVSEFNSHHQNISEVHFVDISKTTVDKIKSAFTDLQERKDSTKKLSPSSAKQSFMSLPWTPSSTSTALSGSLSVDLPNTGTVKQTKLLYSDMARSQANHSHMMGHASTIPDPATNNRQTNSGYNTRSKAKSEQAAQHAMSKTTKSTAMTFAVPNSKITLMIITGDIVSHQSDAIVSIEDKRFTGNGAIAREIKKRALDSYRYKHSRLYSENQYVTKTEVVTTPSYGGQLLCKFIFQTIAPRWGLDYRQYAGSFERDLRLTVKHILQKTADMKLNSIALPFFGTCVPDDMRLYPTPVETCCKSIVQGILEWTGSHTENSVRKITLVCIEPAICTTFADVMEKEIAAVKEVASTVSSSPLPQNPTCAICMNATNIASDRWITLNCRHSCHEQCVNLRSPDSSIVCIFCKISSNVGL